MPATALPPQLIGILTMSAAAAVFVGHDAITKYLAERYPLGEIIFWRQLASAILLTGYVWFAHGLAVIRPVNITGQALRAGAFLASTVLIASSVAVLPLPTAVAVVFSSPLVVALLSATLLGEPVGPRRWAAIIAGFIGVLIIVRPGGTSFTWLLLVPVMAATASALRDITTRRLHRTDNTHAILFWSNIAVLACSLTTVFWGWEPVTTPDAALLIVAGFLNTLAHFLTITALRYGEASVVTPYRYSALVWAALIGYLVWGTLPDTWTVAGSLVIVCAGVYLAIREGRQKATPGPVKAAGE